MLRSHLLLSSLALFTFLLASCDSEGSLLNDDDDAVDDDDTGDDDDASDDDDAAPPTFPESVELTTEDGLTLVGTFQAAPGVSLGPAVLLLHEQGRDRHDYDAIWSLFHSSGIATLAFDFRSHGASDSAAVDLSALETDPDQLHYDVQAALGWLAAQPVVDSERVGVMGLAMGANMAVVANHFRAEWGVSSVVAVSADIGSIEALSGGVTLDLENALYAASDGVEPQSSDATSLEGMTADPKDLRLIVGTASVGAALLQASPDARQGSVDWFAEQL